MIDIKTKNCIDTVIFFSSDAENQKANLKNIDLIKPWFFQSPDRNYYFAIACIFKTYLGNLYDYLNMENNRQIELLDELNSLIENLMYPINSLNWSTVEIFESPYWRVIRKIATEFLTELDEKHEFNIIQFDIEDLINPDEFGGSNF